MSTADYDELWHALDEFGFGSLIADTRMGLRTRPFIPVIDRIRNEITSIADAAWLGSASAGAIDAAMSFVNEYAGVCLCVRGTMWVSIHDSDIAAAWTGHSSHQFPGGPREPGIVALRTSPHSAECWDLVSAAVRQQWRFT